MTAAVAVIPSAVGSKTFVPSRADLDVARSVLASRRLACARSPPRSMTGFARAVDLLDAVTGRVVVSGMGKSGHVARKIAATLASTGTPALFVHPAEASHGDLGMIVAGDAVLALSNSGETAELADLVGHTRRFALPLVAITARRRLDARRGRGRGTAAAGRCRGLPHGAGADHLHHHADGARRRAGRRACSPGAASPRPISAASTPAASWAPACGACAS